MAVFDGDGVAWVSTPNGIVRADSPAGRAEMLRHAREVLEKLGPAHPEPERTASEASGPKP